MNPDEYIDWTTVEASIIEKLHNEASSLNEETEMIVKIFLLFGSIVRSSVRWIHETGRKLLDEASFLVIQVDARITQKRFYSENKICSYAV